MTPPLIRFRGVVRELIAAGITPTPTAIAKHTGGMYVKMYTGNSGPAFQAGKYTAARAEELIKAGWLRIQHGKVFRWEPVQRDPDTSEGHPVVSRFRLGDRVMIYNGDLLQAHELRYDQVFRIGMYESGMLLDREDVPEGATALCVVTHEDETGTDTVMTWDDELILVEADTAWPIR